MSPGSAAKVRFAIGRSSLGALLVAASPAGLCAILLGDDPAQLLQDLRRRFPTAELIENAAELAGALEALIAFIEDPRGLLELPLDPRGTPFQRRVWESLRAIPAGETITYGELAERVGDPRATRAVAAACGANPLAVAIPCHRVVRKGGGLSGYRWGLDRKRALLEREAGNR